jgi:hypothetical protein
MQRSKRHHRKKFSNPVNFSKICVVLDTKGFDFQLIAALPAESRSEWKILTQEELERAGCRLPQRFIVPYILLSYVTQKYYLRINRDMDLLRIPKNAKTYTDVVILYKKLRSSERPPEWSEEVPEVFLPPMGPFSYHYFSGNKVIRYNGTIQKLCVMNEKILKQIGFKGENISDEVLAKAGQDCYLTLEECEQILQDRKFSGQANELLELLSELYKTSVGFEKDMAAKPAGQEALLAVSPTHFRSVEDVLRIGVSEKRRWFRESGPIAVDFDDGHDGTVFINKRKLAALETHVLNYTISMLVGAPATGKTALVRSLAYKHKDGKTKVFYFECTRDNPIDVAGLLCDIKSNEGIYIIENIHLQPRKLRDLVLGLGDFKNRHILFTSIPLFEKREYLSSEELNDVHFFPQLEPLEDADEVINLYTSQQFGRTFSPDKLETIRELAAGSYRLLGYILDAVTRKKGNYVPKKCLKDWVNRELEHLEYGMEGSVFMFPEVLVAISALFREGVLMAERYLLHNLGFDEKVLNDLVERGAITIHKGANGDVFYGLQNSDLAKLYWEYGETYKRRKNLPELERFIYSYATSGASNGLEAVMSLDFSSCIKVLTELHSKKQLAKVIEFQGDFLPIYDLVESFLIRISKYGLRNGPGKNTIFMDFLDPLRSGIRKEASRFESANIGHDLLRIVAQKIVRAEELWLAFGCLALLFESDSKFAQELWKKLPKRNLAARLIQRRNIDKLPVLLNYLAQADKKSGAELCDAFPVKQLGKGLNHLNDIALLARCVSSVCKANPVVGRELAPLLNNTKMAKTFSHCDDARSACVYISSITSVKPNLSSKLCRSLEIDQLAKTLRSSIDPWGVFYLLCVIFEAKEEVGQKLLDAEAIEKRLKEFPEALIGLSNVAWTGLLFFACQRISPKFAEEIWQLLNKEKLIKELLREKCAECACICISSIFAAKAQWGWELWNLLDLKKFARILNNPKNKYLNKYLTKRGIMHIYDVEKSAAKLLVEFVRDRALKKSVRIEMRFREFCKGKYYKRFMEKQASRRTRDRAVSREFRCSKERMLEEGAQYHRALLRVQRLIDIFRKGHRVFPIDNTVVQPSLGFTSVALLEMVSLLQYGVETSLLDLRLLRLERERPFRQDFLDYISITVGKVPGLDTVSMPEANGNHTS